MNSIQLFTDLFHHSEWADSLIWKSVLDHPAVIHDSKIRERLHHIHLCQHAWLRIWLGEAVDAHAGESLDVHQLSLWAREYHTNVAEFQKGIQESQLDRRIAMPGVDQESARPCLWETFLQIISHSI